MSVSQYSSDQVASGWHYLVEQGHCLVGRNRHMSQLSFILSTPDSVSSFIKWSMKGERINKWMNGCSSAPRKILTASGYEFLMVLSSVMLSSCGRSWDGSTQLQRVAVSNRPIISKGTWEISQSRRGPWLPSQTKVSEHGTPALNIPSACHWLQHSHMLLPSFLFSSNSQKTVLAVVFDIGPARLGNWGIFEPE